MDLSSNSKIIKKKQKKKIRVPDTALLPLIKPDKFDGVSNWMKMQEVLGNVGNKAKTTQDKKNNLGIKLNTSDYKPPFSHKANVLSSEKQNYPNKLQSGPSKGTLKYSDVVKNITHNPMVLTSDKKKNQTSSHFSIDMNTKNVNSNNDNETQMDQSQQNSEIKLTKAVAIDCEMVGTGPSGEDSMIARVSIVNACGDCLYDEFVKPKEKVTDYRTQISGIRPSDLKKGKDLFEVQKEVLNIIEGRILVGHAIKHDLDVLFISHPRHLIRDTSYYKPFRELCGGRTPSLKKLTSKILGCEIQNGEHSSVEDAQAAMLLYLRQKREWEHDIKSRRKRKPKMIKNLSES